MLSVVDIGNTDTVFGFFKNDALIYCIRVKTDTNKTEDEIFSILLSEIEHYDIDLSLITGAIISCVVPNALNSIERLFNKRLNLRPYIVNHEDHGVLVSGNIMPDLGSDLVVNAIAAKKLFQGLCLIIDLGTALTFSLLECEKLNYIGAAIAPGCNLVMNSLYKGTAQLPLLNFQKTDKILGTTTEEAILAGSYFGFTSMVEGMIRKIKAAMGLDIFVVATGGFSNVIIGEDVIGVDHIKPDLTLTGLNIFYQYLSSR